MIFGLTGAQGVGKTTLAIEFTKRNPDYQFVPTSVSAIMQELGVSPQADVPIAQRLEIQGTILDRLDQMYAGYVAYTVFDRTPLDVAAYQLADVQRQNVGPEDQEKVMALVRRCFEVTNKHFGALLYIPNALPLVPRDDSAPRTPAYVEHISQLVLGLRSDERMRVRHFTMPIAFTGIDDRVKAMEIAAKKMIQIHMTELETQILNGVATH